MTQSWSPCAHVQSKQRDFNFRDHYVTSIKQSLMEGNDVILLFVLIRLDDWNFPDVLRIFW